MNRPIGTYEHYKMVVYQYIYATETLHLIDTLHGSKDELEKIADDLGFRYVETQAGVDIYESLSYKDKKIHIFKAED